MSQTTLYLVQSSYQHTPQVLAELSKLFADGDHIVFMGDSVAQLSIDISQQFKAVAILATEQALLHPDLSEHIQVLSYADFADLTLTFTRCISFK